MGGVRKKHCSVNKAELKIAEIKGDKYDDILIIEDAALLPYSDFFCKLFSSLSNSRVLVYLCILYR